MSRSAHAQGGIQPRKLPKCSRCKQEFVLVLASYEKERRSVYEWECTKCHKTVPRNFLKEEEPAEAEAFFHKKSKELQEKEEGQSREDAKQALRCNLRRGPNPRAT